MPRARSKAWAALEAVADGMFLARDLVNEPPNVLSPAEFANRAKQLTKLGVKVEVLGEAQMKKLGMGALLGVGQGSERESQLVVMHWNGARAKKAQPVAFVGKGVCFDSGGLSLKTGAGMMGMKGDMGGAAAVIGAMRALATRKARVNAVGVIGLVENMPDGNAQRPDDVVKSMSGQTIEVLNTDAEGRLVLADALTYTQQHVQAEIRHRSGDAHRRDHDRARQRTRRPVLQRRQAGERASPRQARRRASRCGACRSGPGYDKLIKSKIADMKNIGGALCRLDHRRAVPPALRREGPGLGASRYRRHGLAGRRTEAADPQLGHRLGRAAAGSSGRGALRGVTKIDPPWFGPWLEAAAILVMVGGLVYALVSGKVYARGPIIERSKNPSLYWFCVGFFVLAILLPAIYIAVF